MHSRGVLPCHSGIVLTGVIFYWLGLEGFINWGCYI